MPQTNFNAHRLIPRQDAKGNSVIFLADTYGVDDIKVWHKGSDNPIKTDMDYYHGTKPLEAKEIDSIVKSYIRTYAAEVQVMQRLPRVLQDPPKLKKVEKRVGDQYLEKIVSEEVVTEITPEEAFINTETDKDTRRITDETTLPVQSYVMRKVGDLWRVLDDAGKSVAYTVSENDALSILKSLLGNKPLLN